MLFEAKERTRAAPKKPGEGEFATEAKIPTVVMLAGASIVVDRSPYMVRPRSGRQGWRPACRAPLRLTAK
jgi:hypothetical protein